MADEQIALKFKPWIEPEDPSKILSGIAAYDHAEAQARLLGAQTDESRALMPGKVKQQDAATALTKAQAGLTGAKTTSEQQDIARTAARYKALDNYQRTGDPSYLTAFPEAMSGLADTKNKLGMFGTLDNRPEDQLNQPQHYPLQGGPPPGPGVVPPPPSSAPVFAQPPAIGNPAGAPAGAPTLPIAPPPADRGGSGLPIPPMPPGTPNAAPLAPTAPPQAAPPVAPPGQHTEPGQPQLAQPTAGPGGIDPNERHPEVLARYPKNVRDTIMGLDNGTVELKNIPMTKDQRLQAQTLLGQYNPNHIAGINPQLVLSPETRKRLASQYIETKDEKVFSQLGKAGAGGVGDLNRKALMDEITQQMAAKGMDARDLALNQYAMQGLAAAERTLGTQTARMGGAAMMAQVFAPVAITASEAVNRTKFSDLNKIILAGKERTGDEAVVRFGIASNALVTEYAAVMGRGNSVLTDEARRNASSKLQEAWSKGQYAAAVDQLQFEISQSLKAPEMTLEHIRKTFGTKLPVLHGTDEEIQRQYDALPPGGKYQLDGKQAQKPDTLKITVGPKQ